MKEKTKQRRQKVNLKIRIKFFLNDFFRIQHFYRICPISGNIAIRLFKKSVSITVAQILLRVTISDKSNVPGNQRKVYVRIFLEFWSSFSKLKFYRV